MSFDEEWASVRSKATAETGMRLAQAAPGPGGAAGRADLAVDQDRLGAIGSAAFALHTRLTRDGNHARTSTTEAAAQLSGHGFRTGAALAEVQNAWSTQLNTLIDACAHISNHLDYSAASHAREEEDIRVALSTTRIGEFLR